MSHRFHGYTQIFYSSDDTEFIRRFPAVAITHGFTQRRPVRSLQIPPESVLSHRFHRFTQIFSSGFIFHRMTRNLFGDFLLRRLLTDFRGCDLFGRCRYPLRVDKAIHQRFYKKSVKICEICGTKNTKKNLRHLRNLRDKTIAANFGH